MPFVVIILVIFVIVALISGIGRRSTGSSSNEPSYSYQSTVEDNNTASSTKTRTKADTGLSFASDCVKDELGWVESVSSTGKGLESFYDLTGVQPYVYLKAYDATLTSDSEKEAYAESWYDENIDNEGTFLYIYFAEENSSEDIGYMYCVDGYEIASVMDDEAIEIFWDYVEEYWYSDLSTDDMLIQVFDSTAEAIM